MSRFFFHTLTMVLVTALPLFLQGQSITFRGTIKDVPFAEMQLVDNNITFKTDENGRFSTTFKPKNLKDTLIVFAVGFKVWKEAILLDGTEKNIVLQPLDDVKLQEVQISGTTTANDKKNSGLQVAVAELKTIQNQSVDVAQATNRLSGTKIRFSGGAGSDYAISVLGLQGKSVRVFIDGLAAEYLGRAFQLNALSASEVQRVEVYKGVTPIELGADVLGGAVNIVTTEKPKNQIAASYEISSFNTHRFVVNVVQVDKNDKWAWGSTASFQESKNNFPLDIQVTNLQTGEIKDSTARRFHDNFRSTTVNTFFAIRNRKWADELRFSFNANTFERQLQHGFVVTSQPAGNATFQEASIPIFTSYKKQFFKDKLSLSAQLGYQFARQNYIDTSANIYTWSGKVDRQNQDPQEGELGLKSTSLQNRQTQLSRLNLTYTLSEKHQLQASFNQTYFERQGQDTTVEKIINYNPLGVKGQLSKIVGGVGYRYRSLDQRWTVLTAAKYFQTKIRGAENIPVLFSAPDTIEGRASFFGGNGALKYQINPRWFTRLSYEYAGRLPDEQEVLGDGIFINGNPNLKPEKSQNINLGAVFQNPIFRIESNVFYRTVKDIIVIQNALFIPQYDNLFRAEGIGTEIEMAFTPSEQWQIGVNGTYLDYRKRGFVNISEKSLEGKRIPNIPYLFANTSLQYKTKKLNAKRQDQLTVFGYYQYIHSFFLLFEGGITSSRATIPEQHLVDVGTSYSMKKGQYVASFEIHNALNTRAFDYFRTPKPSRSVHLKLNFRI